MAKIESTADQKVTLSLGQLLTYALMLITLGGSIYTFMDAIPEIKELNQRTQDLNVNAAVIQEKVRNLESLTQSLRDRK